MDGVQIGYQTIAFGPTFADLPGVLDALAALGYRGIEFSQAPQALPPIEELLRLLDERGLHLLGLAGGSIFDRTAYCRDVRIPYLYIEAWNPAHAEDALAAGHRLALHPITFRPLHRMSAAHALLEEHPELLIIPDSAHLHIVGDDPALALRQCVGRLASVHLKDWTPEYGRSAYRYSRGFTELGEGVVPLEPFIAEWRKSAPGVWAVVEQDRSRTDPLTSAYRSACWLSDRKLLPRPAPPGGGAYRVRPAMVAPEACPPEMVSHFARTLAVASSEDLEQSYTNITEALRDVSQADLASLWAFSPSRDLGTLVGVSPACSAVEHRTLQCGPALSGIAVDRQAATQFDLTSPQPGLPYGRPDAELCAPEIVNALGMRSLISVPIADPSNADHVRLIANLFYRNADPGVSARDLGALGSLVGRAADAAMDQVCAYAAAAVNVAAGRGKDACRFLDRVRDLVARLLVCDGVTIFVVDSVGDRLEAASTTGLQWRVDEGETHYAKGEGITGGVWANEEPVVGADAHEAPGRVAKSVETVGRQLGSFLVAPLLDAGGEVVGVVRCQNKRSADGRWAMYSDDDLAILDAIGQAVVPHLVTRLADERRIAALGRLTHELKVPLGSIRGAVDLIQHTRGVREMLPYDYLGDILSWCDIMRRLVGNADVLRSARASLPLECQPTFLKSEVIAAAVRQAGLLLRGKRFSENRIQYDDFEAVPRLWIDRSQFQQVMFNLLSNSIKYAFSDPDAFYVEIAGDRRGGDYVITFRDRGTGIPSGADERIFQEGARGRNALERNVAGQGLGLFVVRQIVEAHGGSVRVTHTAQPTEITITLPGELALQPPGRKG